MCRSPCLVTVGESGTNLAMVNIIKSQFKSAYAARDKEASEEHSASTCVTSISDQSWAARSAGKETALGQTAQMRRRFVFPASDCNRKIKDLCVLLLRSSTGAPPGRTSHDIEDRVARAARGFSPFGAYSVLSSGSHCGAKHALLITRSCRQLVVTAEQHVYLCLVFCVQDVSLP